MTSRLKNILKNAGFVSIGAVILACAIMLLSSQGQSQDASERPHYAHSTLVIAGQNGAQNNFAVEVATSDAEQSYGLMFVKSLDDDQGMIFPYNPPRVVAFWMKNTLISLDMLFVRPDRTIGRIVSMAKPQDLTPIPSQEPVIAVIEINGGLAKKKNINVGDKVESPILLMPR